jgi:hypothetical protein
MVPSSIDFLYAEEWSYIISQPKMYEQRKLKFIRKRLCNIIVWHFFILYFAWILWYGTVYPLNVPSPDGKISDYYV